MSILSAVLRAGHGAAAFQVAGLQEMFIFGEDAGGNPRTLSLVHATGVLVIVVALPFPLKGIWQADLTSPPGAPISAVAVEEMVLMVVGAAVDRWAAVRVGPFGASIVGPLIRLSWRITSCDLRGDPRRAAGRPARRQATLRRHIV